jgi:hypothetical protein
MSMLGDLVNVKKCRRNHVCWWCGTTIPKGTSYDRWTWEEDGSVSTIKCHHECRKAWNKEADAEGGQFYVVFGEFERPEA